MQSLKVTADFQLKMTYIPDRKHIEDFADGMIKHDKYVRLSVKRDKYMTRDEYVISYWINSYCNNNCPHMDDNKKQREAWLSLLPAAYQAITTQFDLTPEKAKELFEKSLTIRSRHMNL